MMALGGLAGVTVAAACASNERARNHEVLSRTTSAIMLTNTHPVEGYADKLSYTQGDTVNLHVHVPSSTTYTYSVYRYGASGANGAIDPGNPVYGPISGTADPQPYPDNAAIVGLTTWPVTSSFTIGPTWSSGIYAARLDSTSGTSYVSFVVRDAGAVAKPRVLVASTNTWEAYNMWPYDQAATAISYYGDCHKPARQTTNTISFLRPNPLAWPDPPADRLGCLADGSVSGGYGYQAFFYRNEHLMVGDVRIAQWLEMSGLTYSVITDEDLDRAWTGLRSEPHGGHLDASILDASVSPTLIISTHNEYWSGGMETAVEEYQRVGGNVVSLSGNSMYHIVSYGTSNGGTHMTRELDWEPTAKTNILGTITANIGTGAPCVAYSVTRPSHWAFASTAFSVDPPPALGTTGEMSVLGAIPSSAGVRTFCVDSGAGGAVGEETDAAPLGPAHAHDGSDPGQWCGGQSCNCSNPGTSDFEADRFVGFMRTYSRLAESSAANPASNIIVARKASAGMLFNAASITFGQSLLWDAFQSPSPMSATLRNVFNRFSSRSFSDFSGDGVPDVVMRGGANLYMGKGNGSGGFVQGAVLVASGGWDQFDAVVSAGDFDSDGHPDLLARCATAACPAGAGLGDLVVYHGDGSGGLLGTGHVVGSAWGGMHIAGLGDFDGDGNPDVLGWTDTAVGVTLFKGNGNDGWVSPSGTDIFIDSRTFDMLIPVGDYNGDGTADVLARTSAGSLYLCRGNGDGTFAAAGCGSAINAGWSIFSDIIPVGDFKGIGQYGDNAPRPAMLGKNANGDLVLYTGSRSGCVETNYGIVDSGWNAYSPIVGVW